MSFDPHENPYAARAIQPVAATDNAESIRREHISHEASVKSMGFLFLLGGIIALLIGLVYLAVIVSSFFIANSARDTGTLLILSAVAAFAILVGSFQLAIGLGVRRLASWARIPAVAFSAIGLLAFPIGTLINGYFIYLLICQKGSTVFSNQYKSVIAATPNIKYKTSIIVWIFVGLLVALLAFGVVGAIFA